MRSPLARLSTEAIWLFLVVGASSAVVYLILYVAPGTEESMPNFWGWLGGVLQLQFGESTAYRIGADVGQLLWTASLESFLVVGFSIGISMGGAAILTVLWQGRGRPQLALLSRGMTYLVSASPAFLLAYWVLFGTNESVQTGIRSGWLEPPMWFPVPSEQGFVHYILAATVLAVGSGMLMEAARGLAEEVERIMSSEFVLFARAGGSKLARHVIPNLLGPVASLTLNRLTALFGGAVVVEVIFNVPGLGRLTWYAAIQRDSRVLLGATVLWALLYALGRLGAEAASILGDPRRRAISTEGSA